ncbi:hypothetical protein AAKU55_002632 [Oxalobacteraceae bacterium GrIS 1.11]
MTAQAGRPSPADDARDLLPVTTDGDGSARAQHTRPVSLTNNVLAELLAKQAEVKRYCDSLAIYRSNEKDWLACSIYYEGMCLVKNVTLFDALAKQRFQATAPTGW